MGEKYASSGMQRSGSPTWQKRSFRPKAVGAFVPKLTAQAFQAYGFPAAALVTDWAAIVGADLARITEPERLRWPPRQTSAKDELDGRRQAGGPNGEGATFVLKVDSTRALEVQFKTAQIMERINTYFGYRAVTGIRIVQQAERLTVEPENKRRPAVSLPVQDDRLQTIEDAPLREALARLAQGVRRT